MRIISRGILYHIDQQIAGLPSDLIGRLVYGRQGRMGDLGKIGVVKADYADILRNGESFLLRDADGGRGKDVGDTEEGAA